MRFMMLVIPKGYETAAPDVFPDAKHVEQMMKYNEWLDRRSVRRSQGMRWRLFGHSRERLGDERGCTQRSTS